MVECLYFTHGNATNRFIFLIIFETHKGSKWREPIFAFVFEGVLDEFT